MKRIHLGLLLSFWLCVESAIAAPYERSDYSGSLPCTYFVAPGGSDDHDGKSAKNAFATLRKAQSAARRSDQKIVCLRAGLYRIGATLTLTEADNGETWRYYLPDGVDTAVLDGGNTVDLFTLNGASKLTINGLKMQHVYDGAIITMANSPISEDITIENCDIGFNQHTNYAGGFNPMIAIGNARNTRILNNYIHDTASQAVGLYAYNSGDTIDGSVISGNVVLRAVQQMNDGGAIYINMRKTNLSGGHVTIANNFVKDFGGAGIQAQAIYLDDDASNVEVLENVIGPMNPGATGTGSKATAINGGCCNNFVGNIIDLGSTAEELIAGWTEPGGGGALPFKWMGPNVFKGNVIVANYSGRTRTSVSGISGRPFVQGWGYPPEMGVIADNVYFNYGGGGELMTGNIISDKNPVMKDPNLSGWFYESAGEVRTLPSVTSKQRRRGWGPPGLVIPHDGAPPSNPH